MAAAHPTNRPARPGLGLLTCAAAALLLGVLGYAVATKRSPGSPLATAERVVNSAPAEAAAFAPWPESVGEALPEPPAVSGPLAFSFAPVDPTPQPVDDAEPSDDAAFDEPAPAQPPTVPAEAESAEWTPADRTAAARSAVPPAGPLFAPPGAEVAWDHLEVNPPAGEAWLTLSDPEAKRAGATEVDELLDTPSPRDLSRLLREDVQQAYALGRSGAVYAARRKFVGVLRKVASSKDAAGATDRHTQALAAGLRALDEAMAFLPKGDAVEADLDVAALAASHRTPLYAGGKAGEQTVSANVLPHEAIARYHRFAQHKLALVAAGDEAASMALHGLGKSFARLAQVEAAPMAEKTSLTMYRAAVEAHPANYLAANELGVGLARLGKYEAAEQALTAAVSAGAGSTVYRNLAVVQHKLGRPRLAQAATTHAERLAKNERSTGEFSRQNGVKWVPPAEFTRVADAYRRRGAKHAPAPRRPTKPAVNESEPARPGGPAVAADRAANAAVSRRFAPLRTAERTPTDRAPAEGAPTPPPASRPFLR